MRDIGSGSIVRATSVLRTGRRDLAFGTLVADGGKGAAAALIVYFWAARTGTFSDAMRCRHPAWRPARLSSVTSSRSG